MRQVAEAIPSSCRGNIVIVGSLAAGYQLSEEGDSFNVRTKDIDCVLFPHASAVVAGTNVAQALIDSGWTPKDDPSHPLTASAATPDHELPVVRLFPPGSQDYFLELLSVPQGEGAHGKQWSRVVLRSGHYGLPSFEFLGLAAFRPTTTESGIACARPEMMALANLLEHPEIKPDLMSGQFAGRSIKRSNKDLGRVLAIAVLTDPAVIESWPSNWFEALRECYPTTWNSLAATVGTGLLDLLASGSDLEEALHVCNNGLLAGREVTMEELMLAGNRVMGDAVARLQKLVNESQY